MLNVLLSHPLKKSGRAVVLSVDKKANRASLPRVIDLDSCGRTNAVIGRRGQYVETTVNNLLEDNLEKTVRLVHS